MICEDSKLKSVFFFRSEPKLYAGAPVKLVSNVSQLYNTLMIGKPKQSDQVWPENKAKNWFFSELLNKRG